MSKGSEEATEPSPAELLETVELGEALVDMLLTLERPDISMVEWKFSKLDEVSSLESDE